MYDFQKSEDINSDVQFSFDMVIIDPPFITRDVWEKYAVTTRLLLKRRDSEDSEGSGLVMATTVAENQEIMKELFHATPTVFKPKLPNLVYQYNVYTNFYSELLSKPNPEIK